MRCNRAPSPLLALWNADGADNSWSEQLGCRAETHRGRAASATLVQRITKDISDGEDCFDIGVARVARSHEQMRPIPLGVARRGGTSLDTARSFLLLAPFENRIVRGERTRCR